jgi:hypothetical protein
MVVVMVALITVKLVEMVVPVVVVAAVLVLHLVVPQLLGKGFLAGQGLPR